jgi:hypothetical protein
MGDNEIDRVFFESLEKDCPLSCRKMILQAENAVK